MNFHIPTLILILFIIVTALVIITVTFQTIFSSDSLIKKIIITLTTMLPTTISLLFLISYTCKQYINERHDIYSTIVPYYPPKSCLEKIQVTDKKFLEDSTDGGLQSSYETQFYHYCVFAPNVDCSFEDIVFPNYEGVPYQCRMVKTIYVKPSNKELINSPIFSLFYNLY